MKSKDFNKLAKDILPRLDGYRVKGAMIFSMPVGHILRGVSFESSSHDAGAFYMWTFFQPLCVPVEYLVFNLGFRLADDLGQNRWSVERPDLINAVGDSIIRHAVPYLKKVETAKGAADVADNLCSQNKSIQESAAYSAILAGDGARAGSQLMKLIEGLDVGIAWQHDILIRVKKINELLDINIERAQECLGGWEMYTARSLNIVEYLEF